MKSTAASREHTHAKLTFGFLPAAPLTSWDMRLCYVRFYAFMAVEACNETNPTDFCFI